MKTAVLFLTTHEGPAVEDRFRSIEMDADRYVMFESVRNLRFSDEIDVLSIDVESLPYPRLAQDSLFRGSTLHPVLQFLRHHRKYDAAWLIEDDVVYRGDWSKVDELKENRADFIGVSIEPPPVDWCWLDGFVPGKRATADLELLRAYCFVCRITRRAANCLHALMLEGWRGHHEIVFPTGVCHGGLAVDDLVSLGLASPRFCSWKTDLQRHEYSGAPANTFTHPIKIAPRRLDPVFARADGSGRLFRHGADRGTPPFFSASRKPKKQRKYK